MRTFAEWLVVPLVILPLLAAGGLLVWAQDAHRRDLSPYREDGAQAVRDWLAGGSGLASQLPFDPRIRDLFERACEVDGVLLEHSEGQACIVHRDSVLGRATWTFTDDYPGGLQAEALADPAIRLQVEGGRPQSELEGVGAAALSFRDLLDAPALDSLRAARLPCSTKRFLVYRWLERDPAHEPARAAARFLEIACAYERARLLLPSPLPPGAWRAGDLQVLVEAGPARRTAVYSESSRWSPAPEPVVLVAEGEEDDPVRLVWAFPEEHLPRENVLWSGRVERPFAGAYAFQAKHGLVWWRAPRVRRWIAPFVGLLLASLLIPMALLVTLRRRRRLDEARVRFLNELAHDLRTPLTSLRLHADLLTGGKARPEKKDAYAARMAVEAARLSSLLGNLLDLTRLERGRREYDRQRVVVSDVVDDARREFVAVFPERKGDLDLAGDADTSVAADRSALARVLANLLENAGKFTARGTPIRVRWSALDRGAQIVVEDEGDGIPSEERGRVFERYGRGEQAQLDGVPGTGLGLALVRELAEGMGGTVTLRAGTGAVFEIRLGEKDA